MASRDRGPIGETICQWREKAGVTGAELASDLGWQASKLSRIETGQTRPAAADLRRIGVQLEVPSDDVEALVGQLPGFEPRRPSVPYQTVMMQLGFVRLPDGGWACSDEAARSLVEMLQA